MFKLEVSEVTEQQSESQRKVSSETAADVGEQTTLTELRQQEKGKGSDFYSEESRSEDRQECWEDCSSSEAASVAQQSQCSECREFLSLSRLEEHLQDCPQSNEVPRQHQSYEEWIQHSPLEEAINVSYPSLPTSQDWVSLDSEEETRSPNSVIPGTYLLSPIVNLLQQPDQTHNPTSTSSSLPTTTTSPPVTVGPTLNFGSEGQRSGMQAESQHGREGVVLQIEFSGDNSVTTLYIYSRNAEEGPTYLETILNLMQSRLEPLENRGLTEAEIEALPLLRYSKVAWQGSDCCSICMHEFEQGQQLMTLPCSHTFNQQCIKPWLRTNYTCPNCRRQLRH